MRLHVPSPTPPYGTLFVDFFDNARNTTLKALLDAHMYLNDNLCWVTEARNTMRVAPQCSVCQRWGHSVAICRCATVRCVVCWAA
jgi:hypothetical protein